MYILVLTIKPVHYLAWCNSYHYFRGTLVTLEKASLWGEMMNKYFLISPCIRGSEESGTPEYRLTLSSTSLCFSR